MWNTTETIVHDLPDWMRQARRGVDWGVLLVIMLSLIAAWPMIFYADLPHTNASENYVYRAADYAEAFQEGRLYPRWSANALSGYGAPIPHYYPPGAAYIAALLQILLTDDPVLAVRLVYIFALCGCGVAVYALVTRHTGATVGLLASVLFVYSPYVSLVAPQVLGDLPGVISLALIPTLLWAIDRLITANRPSDVILVAFSTAGLGLTSIRATFVGLLVAGIFALWAGWRVGQPRAILRVLLGILLGIGLAGFYWLPALLEHDAVHWQSSPLRVEPRHLTLGELFAPLRPLDANELRPSAQLTIGWLALGFAALGGAAAFFFKKGLDFQSLFLVVGVVLLVMGLWIFPGEVWLLGPVMMCLAVGGSAAFSFRNYLSRRWKRLLLPILLVFIWVGSSPIWFAPQAGEPFGNADAAAQILYEQQGYGSAVLPPEMPIPTSLSETLLPNRLLIESYQSEAVNKIGTTLISDELQASPLVHLSHSDQFQLRRVAAPTSLEVLTTYFPGWTAALDGRSLPLTRRPGSGLIQVELPTVPIGNSELTINLGPTAVRTGSWLVADCILLICLILTAGQIRQHKGGFEEIILLSRTETRLLAVPIMVFAVVTFALSTLALPFSLRARPGYGLENSTGVNARTDAGLSLLSFRLDRNEHSAGDEVNITLYWQAQRFLTEDYQVTVYLVNNRDNSRWSATPLRQPGYYPTQRWNTRQYVSDRYGLALPADITPGNYQITLEVYPCKPTCVPENRLTFFSSTGQNLGTSLILPTLVAIHDS